MKKTYTLVERNEAIAKMLGWKQHHLGLEGATYWVDLNGEPFAMPFFNCDWNRLMQVVEHIKYKYHWQIVSHQFIDDELTAENDHVNVYTGEYWCMIHKSLDFASNTPLIDVCGKPSELLAVFTACSDFALLKEEERHEEANKKNNIALKTLADVLTKYGVRKHLCIGGVGYSQIERDIVQELSKIL